MGLTKSKVFGLTAGLFCILSSAFWFILSFPGILVGDNISMLVEALPGNSIGDQHSVMMIWLLRLSNKLFGYHFFYPLLWGVVWWHVGVFFYTSAIFENTQRYWGLTVIFALSFLPFITFAIPHLPVKDFAMSSTYFAASGLLLKVWLRGGRQTSLYLLVFFLFFFAITFRHNAIFAFIPFSLVFANICFQHMCRVKLLNKISKTLTVIGLGAVFTVSLFIIRSSFDSFARDYRNHFTHSSLFLFDLAGISVVTGAMELPGSVLENGVTITDLEKCFNPAGWDPLWGGWGNSQRIVKSDISYAESQQIFNKWINALVKNPKAYLEHRMSHFDKFIYWRNNYIQYDPWATSEGWQLLVDYTPDHLKDELKLYSKEALQISAPNALSYFATVNSFLSRKFGKWLYAIAPHYCLTILISLLACCLVLIAISFRANTGLLAFDNRILIFATSIIGSGALYFLSYFFISISSDWRYIHWSQLSMWIGIILLINYFLSLRGTHLRGV